MEPRVYLRAGLTLDWRGYSLYDRAVMACELPLQESHTTAITSSAYRRIEMQPGEQTKKLRLLRQLGSRQINGSVWLCETVDKAGQPVQVVLKLFSSALHPYGAWSTLQNTMPDTRQSEPEYMHLMSSELACYRETMAHERLRHLQGVHIPYSYGFYRFTFPPATLSGPVIGHVTEYVDAYEPHLLFQTLLREGEISRNLVYGILASVFDIYAKIHKEGVAHQDVACRNMRVVWDAERRTLPRIVILDFDRAEVGQDGWYVATEEDTIQDFLSELGVWGSDDVITDWVEGPGSVQYDGFAIDLLPPHMREARRKVKEQGRLENRLFNESEEGKRLDAEWKAGLQASSGMQQAPKEYEVISTGTLGDLDSGME